MEEFSSHGAQVNVRECGTKKLWSNSPPRCYCVFVPAAAEGRVLFVCFFLSPRGCPLSSMGTVGTLAECNSPGCFPYLCSISSSAWAGKFKCSVTLTPWRLSLYRQSDPPTKILLPREDLSHFPIKKRVFQSVARGQKTFLFFFPNWKEWL